MCPSSNSILVLCSSAAFSKGAKTRQTILVRSRVFIAILVPRPAPGDQRCSPNFSGKSSRGLPEFQGRTPNSEVQEFGVRPWNSSPRLFLQARVDRFDKHVRCPRPGRRTEARVVVGG